MPNTLNEDDSYQKARNKVAPGKLISTDLFQWIIARLRTLDEKIREGGGEVSVPRVFGQTLRQAVQILEQSSVDLQVGDVLDASGKTIDPTNSDVLTRIVIGQMPGAGTRTTSGDGVDLVLSVPQGASDGGGDGNGAATGFIRVSYQTSPDGTNVVPNPDDPDTEYVHRFTVRNETDRSLPIQLTPIVTGIPGINWTDAVEVRKSDSTTDDSPITSITVKSTKEKTVDVVLEAPAGLDSDDLGKSLNLKLNANVGPPHDLTATDDVDLTVKASEGSPVTRNVEIKSLQTPITGTDDVNPDQVLGFSTDLRYTTDDDTNRRVDFTYTMQLSAVDGADLSSWSAKFTDRSAEVEDPPSGLYQTTVPLDADADDPTRVSTQITPPSSRPQSGSEKIEVTFKVEATVEGQTLSASRGPVTITLRSSS